MSKRKQGFKTYESNSINDTEPFIRLSFSLLESPLFLNLQPNAKNIYIYMKKNAGNTDTFTFPRGVYEKRYKINSKTFNNNLQLLIDNGFIECIEKNKNIRKPNVYKFSSKWREYTNNTFQYNEKTKRYICK